MNRYYGGTPKPRPRPKPRPKDDYVLIHKRAKKIDASLTEYGVFTYPKGLEGWRLYRIEYGGHAEDCVYEGMIWLPPHVDPTKFEEYLEKLQEGM